MAHEVETMAYANEVPWHGLGVKVENDLDAAQMMAQAKVDWQVAIAPNCHGPDAVYGDNDLSGQPIEGSNHIIRVSDGAVLGPFISGDGSDDDQKGYKLVQNSEMFEFFQEFIDDGSMYMHTAGSLHGGQKVWAMASTKEGFFVDKEKTDEVYNNLLFAIHHTGRNANIALQTPIRVVCANTMRMALSGAEDIIKHNHRVAWDEDAREAMKVALGISKTNFGLLEKFAKDCAKRALSGEEEINFFRTVFGGKTRETDGKVIQPEAVRKAMAAFRGQVFNENTTNKETKSAEIARLKETVEALMRGEKIDEIKAEAEVINAPDAGVNNGWNLKTSEGTLWGAVQTVNWMIDHKPVRDHGDDIRMDNGLFAASNVDHKTRATDAAQELLAA